MDILETIRKELQETETSRYRISQDTGISQSVLCKIYNGRQDAINSEYANVLLVYFGYQLIKKDGE